MQGLGFKFESLGPAGQTPALALSCSSRGITSGLKVWDLGFRIWGLGFTSKGLGFRIWPKSMGFWFQVCGWRIGFVIWGLGFGGLGLRFGFRIWGFCVNFWNAEIRV